MGFNKASKLTLLLALIVSSQSTSAQQDENFDHDDESLGTEPDYRNPVRNGVDDEIQSLPGLNEPINFRQFSGYLRADNSGTPKKFLHYWFVESQKDPNSAPLLLWLNGGPGCSSLGGLFTELGPFMANQDGKTLSLNPNSWNKVANVLFLESPAGVGFSYSRSLINYNNDDSTASQNHIALKSFMEKFPHLANNKLYLAGESYAGVYLPTLGQLVDADRDLNLKGIAIGNGYLDSAKLSESLVFFTYYHGLIGESSWSKISKHCCNGQQPTRENCSFTGAKLSIQCRYALMDVQQAISSGINPYNLYDKCKSASSGFSKRELIDRALVSNLFNTRPQGDQTFLVFEPSKHKLRVEPPCIDDSFLGNYLNQDLVRKAIHVPKEVQKWETCSMIMYVMQYPQRSGGLSPQIKGLIESKRNLTMLVYNGDVDTVCNFLGDEWFVDDLGRNITNEYSPWKVNKQVAGYVKHYDGITFATLRGSGHMVPGDRPQEALAMISVFLNSTHPNTML